MIGTQDIQIPLTLPEFGLRISERHACDGSEGNINSARGPTRIRISPHTPPDILLEKVVKPMRPAANA